MPIYRQAFDKCLSIQGHIMPLPPHLPRPSPSNQSHPVPEYLPPPQRQCLYRPQTSLLDICLRRVLSGLRRLLLGPQDAPASLPANFVIPPPAKLRIPCGECVRSPICPAGQIWDAGGVSRSSPLSIPPRSDSEDLWSSSRKFR